MNIHEAVSPSPTLVTVTATVTVMVTVTVAEITCKINTRIDCKNRAQNFTL